MKKKISIFVINAVFVGLITMIWTSLVLTYILPTTNATHDAVTSQPDTLLFDEFGEGYDSLDELKKAINDCIEGKDPGPKGEPKVFHDYFISARLVRDVD